MPEQPSGKAFNPQSSVEERHLDPGTFPSEWFTFDPLTGLLTLKAGYSLTVPSLTTTGSLNVQGSLDVDVDLNVDGDAVVDGTTNLKGAVDVDSALNVDSTIHADGAIDTDAGLVADTTVKKSTSDEIVFWHKIADPTAGWLATKTSGWTADRFTAATGGLLVDFSSVVSVGTKAVIVNLYNTTTTAPVFVRPAGDDTYCSNTPNANTEYFACIAGTTNRQQVRIPLNAAYQAEIAVGDTGVDIYVSYPLEELR